MQKTGLWFLLVFSALLSMGGLSLAASEGNQKNVLFITFDDLNDWTGELKGNLQAQTPNLDRLMKQGISFTRAYCTAPGCGPSRTSLLTGKYPHNTGIYRQPVPFPAVIPDDTTLPVYFKQHGYHTMNIGKIFHDWKIPFFDEYIKPPHVDYPDNHPVSGIKLAPYFDWGTVEDSRWDGENADRAIERLKIKQDRPFFMALGFHNPHAPFYAPDEYMQRFPSEMVQIPECPSDDLSDLPPSAQKNRFTYYDKMITGNPKQHRELVRSYLAAAHYMDEQLGRVLDTLEESGYADNTIIIAFSDHGFHLGEKGTYSKFALWERTTHVPFVIYDPGNSKNGKTCDQMISLIDVYPTLCDLCDLPQRKGLDGESLMPFLKNPNEKWDRPALTTWRYNCHSLRSDNWRYTRYANGDEELYNHEVDPQEYKNLATNPAFDSVKGSLAKWFPSSNKPEIGPTPRDLKNSFYDEWKKVYPRNHVLDPKYRTWLANWTEKISTTKDPNVKD